MANAIALGNVAESWTVSNFTFTRTVARAGTRLPTHHHSVAGLHFVRAGRMIETIASRSYHLTAGCVVFKPAGVQHTNRYPTDVESILVEIPETLALKAAVAERTARAWSLNLLNELDARDAGWERVVEGLVIEGLGRLARVGANENRRPRWLDSAVDLAREHHTLTEIATVIGLHPRHIAREFRRHEGVSVGEYARRCRLEIAARSLANEKCSIAAVAVGAGFCDQSHFTNAFRALFGLTPAEYRKRRGGDAR